ncbi:hypothetical protein O181_087730 [Austropuccinia psidii MF-1]|uniref:Uncharacterized protein n=1 Tax=Austropuccinia psidii MF-1 TaxID=1389203 RepID=A0A9Q3P2G8_9BASI|nr:hypothetical protein [Austropuccinia psidii MF-1]
MEYQITSKFLGEGCVEIDPTAASLKGMLDKARKHEMRFLEDSFAYAKDKWDRSHATPDFNMGIQYLYPPPTSITSKNVKRSNIPLQELFLLRPSMEKMLLKLNYLKNFEISILHFQ